MKASYDQMKASDDHYQTTRAHKMFRATTFSNYLPMLVHSNIHIFVHCHESRSMATIAAHKLGEQVGLILTTYCTNSDCLLFILCAN